MSNIQEKYFDVEASDVRYQPGQPCVARYKLDNLLYRAVVTEIVDADKHPRVLKVRFLSGKVCIRGEVLVCGNNVIYL